MTRVLVAATSEIMRAGLEALVTASPALIVVGSALGVGALAREIDALEPDIVLWELEPDDQESVAELLTLGMGPHAPAMVLLTDEAPSAWVAEALRAGVRALLPRQAGASEIVAAIEAAAAGLVALHPEAIDALLAPPPSGPRASSSPHLTLSPRELEVLGMLAEGLGNKTIAWRLGISEHTVKFHVSAIFTKLNVSSRTEAVALGIRQGLILL